MSKKRINPWSGNDAGESVATYVPGGILSNYGHAFHVSTHPDYCITGIRSDACLADMKNGKFGLALEGTSTVIAFLTWDFFLDLVLSSAEANPALIFQNGTP